MKKFLAFTLCLVMILCSFAGCGGNEDEVGDNITIYIGEPIYNFDPAEAYKNDTAAKIVTLLFDNLFVLSEDGSVEPSLVEDYEIDEDEKMMTIELKEDAKWSDGQPLTANDVMYTWQRLLAYDSSYDAAALLYDIKNAKALKNAEAIIETDDGNKRAPTPDDLGVSANSQTLEIKFEDNVDYDSFLVKLTSAALSPVREDVIGRTVETNDWAKSSLTMVSSGPFRLAEVNYEEDLSNPKNPKLQQIELERNTYYFRDFAKDPLNETVAPNKIIIKLKKDKESILDLYNETDNEKTIFFLGDIPLNERSSTKYSKDDLVITDALSTNIIIMNQNAEINGTKLFANKNVRKALSAVIDRQKIADAISFAEPATGIVPNGVFEENSSGELFRDNGTTEISATASSASSLIKASKITPADYSFSISVPAEDEVHVKIAEIVAEAWNKLGFKVTVNAVKAVENPHKALISDEKIAGTKDNKFVENLTAGDFEVAIIDYVAFSADAFSVLAPFAYGYAGTATNKQNSPVFETAPHISGYNSKEYNEQIDKAYKTADSAARAEILHKAEEILIDELPVIPLVFNKSVALQKDSLVNVEFTYYQNLVFTKADLPEIDTVIEAKKETESESESESDKASDAKK